MFRKPFRHVNSLSSPRLTLAMVGLFVLVQGGYRLAGVSFDATPLIHFWQFLDPELLRSRLGESLLYLHSQPPLFNLFLGLVLKLAPGAEAATFGALYLALGLALYLLTFAVMRQLGVGRPVALALSTWLMVSPSFVLYEHWLFYTLPLATLLMTSAWLLGKLLAFGIWIRGFSRLGGPREKPAEASNPTNQQSIFRADDHAASDATADENVRSNDFSRSARATATKVATTNPPIFRAVVHAGRDATADESSRGGSHAAGASGMGARPAIFRAEAPELEVRIAGPLDDAGYVAEVRAEIARLGLEECVKLLGNLDTASLAQEYSTAAVVALPSRQEVAPMVVVEAMAAGVPVIASAVGGVPYLVAEGVTGCTVPAGDPAVLAGALIELLTRPDAARRIGQAAQAVAHARFRPDLIAGQYLALYREMLSH